MTSLAHTIESMGLCEKDCSVSHEFSLQFQLLVFEFVLL